jgi:hypothetical protein
MHARPLGGIALVEALTVQWPTGLHALMAFAADMRRRSKMLKIAECSCATRKAARAN